MVFNIELFRRIPKCVTRYLCIEYLCINDIKEVIRYYPKLFNNYYKSILANMNKGFIHCCRYGYLYEAKQLYKTSNIDVHMEEYLAFKYSCINNHIEIAKWICLFGLPPTYYAGNDIIYCPYIMYNEIMIIKVVYIKKDGRYITEETIL